MGSLTLEGTAAQVDLTSLASKSADGSYTLSVSLADLAPLQVKVMASASVAAMYLTSADPENQGRDYVDADKGNSAEGSMTLVAADGAILYNGALTQIKSRGNSTFLYYDKKSYQIKLDSKSDLLGLGEKGKTWVLLAGYGDATQMHDKLFKDLASQVGLAYSPDCDWVDLYYDGEYRGTYLLSEKNNVNGNTVDITDMEKLYEDIYPDYGDSAVTAEDTNAYGQSYSYTQGLAGPEDLTGGYLLELNHNTIDEANGFHTRQEVAFNIKSPEYGSREAVQYISEYYQEFEDAVYATDAAGNYTGLNPNTGKYYYEYCDLDSLVRLFLVQQFSSNSDAFASSVFFYKDADGIMYAGPVWDMEMSCGTGWDEYIAPDRDFLQLRYLTEALMQIPSFIDAVEQCFDETFAPAAQALLGSDGVIAEYTDTLSASSAMNYVLWPYVRVGNPSHEDHLWGEGTTYSDVTADLSDWLERRLDILTQRYGGQQPDDPDDDHGGGGGGSGGGGGGGGAVSTDHSVTAAGTTHGTISLSADAAAKGETVTITVKPANGYELDILTVTDASGKAVATTDLGNGRYSFTMPGSKVTVEAGFKPVEEEPTPVELPFTDVAESAWYYDAVAYAYANGLMDGTGASSFAPGMTTNRAMLATLLYRLEKEPAVSGAVSFQDVAAGQWYTDAVAWAASEGIVNGVGDGSTFAPNDTITREQMAVMLYRYAQYKGYDVSQGGMAAQEYSDYGQVASWAQQAMQWAVSAGLITGTSDTTLSPQGSASRAEIATILMRFCENVVK